jgi:hypothetical protein
MLLFGYSPIRRAAAHRARRLGRAPPEHRRVAGLVERVAQVERSPRQRRRALRRQQQIDPAGLLRAREPVQLAGAVAGHAPHQRRHEANQRVAQRHRSQLASWVGTLPLRETSDR